MTARVQVEYEKLVAAYWANLTTVLRGFHPDEDLEFLEAWVLDDDPARSLLNLMEAARDYGVREMALGIGEDTRAALALPSFLSQAGELGAVEVNDLPSGLSLAITFKASHASR